MCEAGDMWDISASSSQFFYKPKIAEKNSFKITVIIIIITLKHIHFFLYSTANTK